MSPRIFINPISKNILNTSIDFVNQEGISLGLSPSREEIDYSSGYVGFTTDEFVTYVRQRTNNVNNIILERNHSGPLQGRIKDDGFKSIGRDIAAGFNIIHLDPFKKYEDIQKAARWTAKAIKYFECENVSFEIGTKSAIRSYTINELAEFLDITKKNTGKKRFRDAIEYIVIQSGLEIEGLRNKNQFDEEKFLLMVHLVCSMGCKTKEYNGDFLSNEDIQKRFDLGLDAINIGLELGILETSIVLKNVNEKTKEVLMQIFVDSDKWSRWLPDNSTFLEKAILAGHYSFNDGRYRIILSDFPDIYPMVQQEIYNRIKELHQLCLV